MKIIKLTLILCLSICMIGFNKLDLLDENNPKWDIDSDKDGLPDAFEELIGTDKYNVDSDKDNINDEEEIKLGFDPNVRDLNRNYHYKLNNKYISDNFDLNNKISVTEKMIFESCQIVSEKFYENPTGKTVGEVFLDKYKSIKNFKIIRFESGENGFGAIALNLGDSIIVSYKPTRSFRDWIENFTTQFMPHPQRGYAIEFTEPIINKNVQIYTCGHSLGGLLAQYVTYDLVNKGYKNIKTVTFNSANSFNPKHMQGKYAPPIIKSNLVKDYINVYIDVINQKDEGYIVDLTSINKFLIKSIDYNGFVDINNNKFKESDFKDYEEVVTNYITCNDPLYLTINGGYLGKCNIVNMNCGNLDFKRDIQELIKFHDLKNFSKIIEN